MDTEEHGPSPSLTKESVTALVYQLYGVKVTNIVQLNGFYDKNYHVQIESNRNEENLWPHGYVLKIVNSADSKNVSIIDGQIKAELYLGKKGINCPQPIKTLQGEYYSAMDLSENGIKTSNHLVYLLKYQPGELLKDIPINNEILYKIGKLVATVDKHLEGFHHPAYDSNYQTPWTLPNISDLKNQMCVVEDRDKRDLASAIIKAFETEVVPIMDGLKKGVIHNDFNEQNILVSKMENGAWDLYGIIDFGDIHQSCLVFELAINIAHVSLFSPDPLTAAGHIIAGYSSVRPLPQKEFNLLKVCICIRYCQLVIFTVSAYQKDPGNEYLLTWLKRGAWDVMQLLWNTPRDELNDKWRKIIKSYH